MASGAVRREAEPLRIWTALGTVYVIWGTTYLAIEYVNRTMPTFMAAGVRFLIAGTIMYAFAVRRGDRVGDRPTRRGWLAATVIGGGLLLGGNGLVALSERTVPTGIVALIIALVPLWMALIDAVLLGRRPKPLVVLGRLGGFAGAAGLVTASANHGVALSGLLLPCVASMSWASASLYARTAPLPERPFVGIGMEMLCGGALLVLAGLARGEARGFDLGAIAPESVLGLAYLVVFGSFAGFASYVWLLRNARTSLVSTYAYVNPVVAVGLGWAFLDERVTTRMVTAGVVILVSVALIIASHAERPTPDLTSGAEFPDDGGDEVEGEIALER
ncbi:MAG: EamA family transporter [Actinomycetota bacterium]